MVRTDRPALGGAGAVTKLGLQARYDCSCTATKTCTVGLGLISDRFHRISRRYAAAPHTLCRRVRCPCVLGADCLLSTVPPDSRGPFRPADTRQPDLHAVRHHGTGLRAGPPGAAGQRYGHWNAVWFFRCRCVRCAVCVMCVCCVGVLCCVCVLCVCVLCMCAVRVCCVCVLRVCAVRV